MAYWRMQLHPADPDRAAKYAVESLAAGFIGLDFTSNVGDLTQVDSTTVDPTQKDYLAFAHDVAIGDRVLIILHHFPFAVSTVSGGYNYIREPAPELGVWFRHFRRVDDVRYYADRQTNARSWEQLTMVDAFSSLVDPNSKSYRLIDTW